VVPDEAVRLWRRHEPGLAQAVSQSSHCPAASRLDPVVPEGDRSAEHRAAARQPRPGLFRRSVPRVVPVTGPCSEQSRVNGTRVGYARCSIDEQDVTVQTDQLAVLGVTPDRISIDRGFSGTSRRNRAGRGNARHGTPMRRRRVGTARAVVTMTGPVAGPGVEPGGPPS
jgi:hypothetical protein